MVLVSLVGAFFTPGITSAATVRDEFTSAAFNNNHGTVNWSGNWIEVDGNGLGATFGNVFITGGELSLDDNPDTGGQPSLEREANLSGAAIATLSFSFRTTSGVDTSDSVVLEISNNGGTSWTTLEDFTGISGTSSGSRSIDIVGHAAANTRVRFRVNNLYGGSSEQFLVDDVEIDYSLTAADLALSMTDFPDPAFVGDVVSYTITVSNGGPDPATGVTVTDVLPAGVTFRSATSTQGSCSGTSTVTCSLGTIANGGSAQVIISVDTTSVGSVSNTASVSTTETDPNASNNSATVTTSVVSGTNQICYLVADSGGGAGGNDLLERINTGTSTITPLGAGTGTNNIEAAAYNSATGVLYAADASRLGTLDLASGAFTALPNTFGTAGGALGNIGLTDVDGLAYDATTGVLYGAHARSGNDLLFQIDMSTGQFVPDAFGAGVDYVQVPLIAGLSALDDIAVNPNTGQMYGIMNSSSGNNDRLVLINKVTGASTDIARVMLGGSGLNDIEGLGVDGTGQLWGSTGSNEALYQISNAGVAALSVTLTNGQDYEALDCFSFSHTVTNDLEVTKTVNDGIPDVSDNITYTVTVTNNGPNVATVVQIADALPSGVTFVSSTTTQGVYGSANGNWHVGTLASGTSATLTITASVDTGTEGSTITNTASVSFQSQSDSDGSNDSDSAVILVNGLPQLSVSKIADAANADPGDVITYTVVITSTGVGVATTVLVDDDPSPYTAIALDFDGGGPGTGTFEFTQGSSGLTLGTPVYSDDEGATYTYTPASGGGGAASGYDANVTRFQIPMTGNMSVGGSFTLRYRVLVK